MAERIYGERELELLKEVLDSKRLCSLDGKYTHIFEEKFAQMMGVKYGVAMNSAMSVLHSSVICAGAGAGSEVICDSAFVFGAQAVLYNNAIPKFVDIKPYTHNMDPEKLESAITERTKAVIVTHAWGLPAEIDKIVEIARKYKLLVIEDCAHAILATYKGKYAGTWGDIGSFSFQGSKQMSLGDGGMAITDNEELSKKLNLNAGAPTFFSVAHGLHYNYRMNELTSVVGIAQLERLNLFIKGLQKIAEYYNNAVSECKWLIQQKHPDAISTYHLWAVTFEGDKYGLELEEFKKFLKEEETGLSVGYTQMPAYKHPVIKERLAHAFHCANYREKIEYPDGLCPVAERIIPRIVLGDTVISEEEAKRRAEKIYNAIRKLEGK
ncbi:MAG: DegT/DnrJ/EryC1/StrS family aminotransferase [bacterium]|nr:DegT/DnrJ/EryC1/StrS family aminotransferase [bacterium]